MRYAKSFVRWGTVAMGLLGLVLFSRPAQAEWYVAGQGGVSFSNNFNNPESTGTLAGVHFSDLDLHRAPVYGAKVGYYFDSLKWLGVEMKAFSSTPHLKQQNATLSFGGASASTILPGQDLRVTNWSPINVVVRYQMGPIEPYGGVGLGVFFARIHDGATNTSASSNARPGLNTLPSGSFKHSGKGEWVFRAHDQSAGIRLMAIKPTHTVGKFTFIAIGMKVDLIGADHPPVKVSLQIGNDAGSTGVPCRGASTRLDCR